MDVENLELVLSIAENMTTFVVLLLWLSVERRRNTELSKLIVEDWKRQREQETDD